MQFRIWTEEKLYIPANDVYSATGRRQQRSFKNFARRWVVSFVSCIEHNFVGATVCCFCDSQVSWQTNVLLFARIVLRFITDFHERNTKVNDNNFPSHSIILTPNEFRIIKLLKFIYVALFANPLPQVHFFNYEQWRFLYE